MVTVKTIERSLTDNCDACESRNPVLFVIAAVKYDARVQTGIRLCPACLRRLQLEIDLLTMGDNERSTDPEKLSR